MLRKWSDRYAFGLSDSLSDCPPRRRRHTSLGCTYVSSERVMDGWMDGWVSRIMARITIKVRVGLEEVKIVRKDASDKG